MGEVPSIDSGASRVPCGDHGGGDINGKLQDKEDNRHS